jgi:hypothetical protein
MTSKSALALLLALAAAVAALAAGTARLAAGQWKPPEKGKG